VNRRGSKMAGIAIVDYGMANLRSVQKAFERVGAAAEITSDPHVVAKADKVVLPGVGAFRDAIVHLKESGLAEPIREHIARGRPFLGICLGLQMLFDRSYEDGTHAGLGLLAGEVVRFAPAPGLKVPHMGWNDLRFRGNCPLFKGIPDGSAVYFVHAYFARPADGTLTSAEADYPEPFTAAVWRDNLYATQFHPEKSQAVGLKMLANFAAID
jgi:imidazole glycerol-phosphate synthase subunit HisH